MLVAVMNVRKMRMRVRAGLVPMLVLMRLTAVPVEIMRVSVVLVMPVAVRVQQRRMCMMMHVLFGQV